MVISANSSAASIWAQCPQFGKTCSCALGISLSATMAPSSGLTRSSRPQVSRVCLRSWCASRQSMPSSAVSGFQNDIPIEPSPPGRPGAVASANRSSTSSSVTRSWLTTMVRDERPQRLAASGCAPKSISRWTPSVGSAWNRLSDRPPGPISTSRPTRSGWLSASRIAVPPPRLLPSRCTRSMPSSSSSCDDVRRRSAGSSCRPPAACRSRRSRAGRRAGCGSSRRSAAAPSRSWTRPRRPGRRRAASPAAARRRRRSASPAS